MENEFPARKPTHTLELLNKSELEIGRVVLDLENIIFVMYFDSLYLFFKFNSTEHVLCTYFKN